MEKARKGGVKTRARSGRRRERETVELVNQETGEVVTALPVVTRATIGGSFFMAMQDGFRMLATQKLRQDAGRVLLYMLAEMDWENHVRLVQRTIAEALGMDRAQVSRAVAELVKRDILAPVQKVGRTRFYRMNWAFVWRGNAADLPDAAAWSRVKRRWASTETSIKEPA